MKYFLSKQISVVLPVGVWKCLNSFFASKNKPFRVSGSWYSYCSLGKTLICVTFFFLQNSYFHTPKSCILKQMPPNRLITWQRQRKQSVCFVGKVDWEVVCTVFYEGVGRADNADALHFTEVQSGTVPLLPLEMWIFFFFLFLLKRTLKMLVCHESNLSSEHPGV